jgi:N-succinyldiaminopimelate aminotransferase
VGYVVGPARAVVAIRKLANHTVYNVPHAMQRAALVALRHGSAFLDEARAEYQAARDLTTQRLGVMHQVPDGGSFVFLDFSRWLTPDGDAMDLLEALASEGILLAPGSAFGRAYASWARLCFTALPRAELAAGLDRLADALVRLRKRP